MLEKAIAFHGEFCVGLALGTRIAVAGLQSLHVDEPSKMRDLIVYVEIDRCLADAIQAVAKCTLGKRRLKYVDYGKFAATFVNTLTKKAVRVSVKEEAREQAMRSAEKLGLIEDRKTLTQKEERDLLKDAYMKMPVEDLLNIEDVAVEIPELDLPGFPRQKALCSLCGERVLDGRERTLDGRKVCRSCVEGAYYRSLKKMSGNERKTVE